ncbi:hypothetical protein U0070_008365 [Myodes glareolus]|uniref:Uncharacterized protein n=1 Tax=Myodes glareolus TaxID=447135 RepID=A0AAW0IXW7_MYOGA
MEESCGLTISGSSGGLEKGSMRRASKALSAPKAKPTVVGACGRAVWLSFSVIKELVILVQPLLIQRSLEDALNDAFQLEHGTQLLGVREDGVLPPAHRQPRFIVRNHIAAPGNVERSRGSAWGGGEAPPTPGPRGARRERGLRGAACAPLTVRGVAPRGSP